MTVITEDELRKKVLSKELYEGMDLIIPSGSLLTPAAKVICASIISLA